MSVLRCTRGNCYNIMCDRYSDRFGYICDRCFTELKALKPQSLEQVARFLLTDVSDYPGINLDLVFLTDGGRKDEP